MITPKEQIAELSDTVRLQREIMREQTLLINKQKKIINKLKESK